MKNFVLAWIRPEPEQTGIYYGWEISNCSNTDLDGTYFSLEPIDINNYTSSELTLYNKNKTIVIHFERSRGEDGVRRTEPRRFSTFY